MTSRGGARRSDNFDSSGPAHSPITASGAVVETPLSFETTQCPYVCVRLNRRGVGRQYSDHPTAFRQEE